MAHLWPLMIKAFSLWGQQVCLPQIKLQLFWILDRSAELYFLIGNCVRTLCIIIFKLSKKVNPFHSALKSASLFGNFQHTDGFKSKICLFLFSLVFDQSSPKGTRVWSEIFFAIYANARKLIDLCHFRNKCNLG